MFSTLREEHRIRVFGKIVLRKILGGSRSLEKGA
jgi:hypothetical protein